MEGWIPYTPKKDQDGFRLLMLEIQNHRVLARHGRKCKLVFFSEGEDDSDNSIGNIPYTTVIIGANGIGKSFILAVISEIFRHIKSIQDGSSDENEMLNYRFSILYYLNGHNYRISCLSEEGPRYSCWDNDDVCGLHSCFLPTGILACSVTIADRFKTQKKPDGFYWYLGTRNEKSPNTTGTKTLVRKTVSAIADGLTQDETYRDKLKSLLMELNLEPMMEICYSLRYKNVYLANPMTEEYFSNIFDDWKPYFQQAGSKRKTPPWGYKKYPEIRNNPENIKLIVAYLNKLQRVSDGGKVNRIKYSLENDELREDWNAIKLLSELDIMMYPTIRVFKRVVDGKNAESYPFEESSSGETNQLCQFINILSRIEHHSLILIDEPEASSHPNWQISYMDWINRIFGRFHTCHFIISTHSHLLLSDLHVGSSSVVALKAVNGSIENIAEGMEPYGWTADDILYEVFNVRNPRNEALERDLERAVQLLDEGLYGSDCEIEDLLQRFNRVYRGDKDPLGKLILELEKHAQSRSK